MNDIAPGHPFRLALSYGLPALTLVWLLWTAFDIRYLQGWMEAQGVTRFHYPAIELGVAFALLVLGLGLTRTRLWIVSPAIAILLMMASMVYWLGYTA